MNPIIRACLLGFAFLNTQDTGIAEGWTARDPGLAPCPFHIRSPVADFRSTEFTRTNNGRTECQWVMATANPFPQAVYISVDPGTSIARLQATTFSPFTQANVYKPNSNPCDIDLSGAFNVNDFIYFMSCPYDFNLDGAVDILDYTALLTACR